MNRPPVFFVSPSISPSISPSVSSTTEKNEALVVVKYNKTLAEKEQFARVIYLRAKNDSYFTGIPPEIMTAQACWESGYGTSYAAVVNKNLFGLKPGGKIGAYASINDCIRRYEYILTNLSCYSKLFKLSRSDLKGWALGIGPAGYCPDSNYGSSIWSMISFLRSWGTFN